VVLDYPAPPPLVAYLIILDGRTSTVVFAESAPKARWLAVRAYWRAGLGHRPLWPQMSCCRYTELDHLALMRRVSYGRARCYSEWAALHLLDSSPDPVLVP
jgi:hypothetical protein